MKSLRIPADHVAGSMSGPHDAIERLSSVVQPAADEPESAERLEH